jgi:hypothetical protein
LFFSFLKKITQKENKYKNRFFQTIGQAKLSDEKKLETVQQTTEKLDKKRDSIQVSSEQVTKKEEPPSTPVYIKKRKATGLFSCFGNKKAKASTEQRGQPTLTPSSAGVTPQTTVMQTTSSIQEKPIINYAILPDGKRTYIDAFRDRPGLDMSYKPDDFDNRFVLPVVRIYQKFICIYIYI